MQIIIASTNLHKIREYREMFKALKNFDVLSLNSFSDYAPLPENGATLKDIAINKATHAAAGLNALVIADDSGIMVPLLNGAPGIYSHRYAGENASDTENRKKLLQALNGKSELERSAYFECCIALADPQGLKKCVSARCEGTIANEERGSNGFGYDSIFIKHDYDKTFAELDDAIKNRISHRRKAFDQIAMVLESL